MSSTSLVIREIEIRTIIRFYLIIDILAKINKTMKTNVGKDVKKWQEYLFIAAGLETCTGFLKLSVVLPYEAEDRSTSGLNCTMFRYLPKWFYVLL